MDACHVKLFALAGLFLLILPFSAQASIYAPGATTDPDCGPHDANCGVATTVADIGASFYTYLHATTTDALAEGATNLYFTNARAIAAMTGQNVSLFKNDAAYAATTSSNTWGGTQTFANVPVLGSLSGFVKATAGALSTALVNLTSDVTGILLVANGGTGVAAIQSGFIPFGNGTDAIGTSSALYFDATSGYLGIGTTSPSTALEVQGAISIPTTHSIGDYTVRNYDGSALNDAFRIGYNLSDTLYQPKVSSEPQSYLGLESNYHSSYPGNPNVMEIYFRFQGIGNSGGTLGTPYIEPYYTNLDRATNKILQTYFRGESLHFQDTAGIETLSLSTTTAIVGEPLLVSGSITSQNGIFVTSNNKAYASLSSTGSAGELLLVGTDNSIYVGDVFNQFKGNVNIRGGGSNVITITNAGNVGLGTTLPVSQFANTSAAVLDQTSTGVGPAGFAWTATTSGYAAVLYNNKSATNAHGLLVRLANSSASNRILTLNAAGKDVVVAQGNGSIGIGTTSPFAQLSIHANSGATNATLFAIGSSTATATTTLFSVANTGDTTITGSGATCTIGNSTTITCTSDEDLKENIYTISDPLTKLESIKGVTFTWKDPAKSQRTFMGVLAQDVQSVFPEAVTTNANGDLAVDYGALVAPLIEGVKTLAYKVNDLTAKVTGFQTTFISQHIQGDLIEGKTIEGKTVKGETVCAGSTCIDEQQLRDMLRAAGQSGSTYVPPVPATTTDSATIENGTGGDKPATTTDEAVSETTAPTEEKPPVRETVDAQQGERETASEPAAEPEPTPEPDSANSSAI